MKTEDDPLGAAPVRSMRSTYAAMQHLDTAVAAAGGIALRYGSFYGAADDGLVSPVRRRQFPIVADGAGVSSSGVCPHESRRLKGSDPLVTRLR